MSDLDIRWAQRFSSYKKALLQLTKFIEKDDLNELEQQGFIQAFKYTRELAWKLLKDYLTSQSIENIYGSRDAFRAAFNIELIEDGEGWMKTIEARNQTGHSYNEETAAEIVDNIEQRFFALFVALRAKMQTIQDRAEQDKDNG